MSVSLKGRSNGTTVWVCKSDPGLEALFTKQEDPRKCESCHAWFFRNGVLKNHFILRSSYILENFVLRGGEDDGRKDKAKSGTPGKKDRSKRRTSGS